tara:strand:+ start:103 stop:351 length:249 start_codon:yes stop_codon:yes gene_type:complete
MVLTIMDWVVLTFKDLILTVVVHHLQDSVKMDLALMGLLVIMDMDLHHQDMTAMEIVMMMDLLDLINFLNISAHSSTSLAWA